MQYIMNEVEYQEYLATKAKLQVAESRITTLNRIQDEMGSKIASLNSKLSSTFGEQQMVSEKLDEANKTIASLRKQLTTARAHRSYWHNEFDKLVEAHAELLTECETLKKNQIPTGSDFDIDKHCNFVIVGHINDDGTITRY